MSRAAGSSANTGVVSATTNANRNGLPRTALVPDAAVFVLRLLARPHLVFPALAVAFSPRRRTVRWRRIVPRPAVGLAAELAVLVAHALIALAAARSAGDEQNTHQYRGRNAFHLTSHRKVLGISSPGLWTCSSTTSGNGSNAANFSTA